MTDRYFFDLTTSAAARSNALWEYACKHYQLPEVQKICLQMQDHWQADVNVLLAAGWAAQLRKKPDWSGIPPAIGRWQREIVRSVRKIRNKLNKHSAAENSIRSALLTVELDAEKTELAQLFHWLTNEPEPQSNNLYSPAQLTNINITNYLQLLDPDPSYPDGPQQLSLLTEQLSYWLSG